MTRQAGARTVIPRMVVADLDGAVRFLRDVLGGSGEVQAGRPAEVRIGDSLVMVSQAGERDLFPAFLYVYVTDADGTYRRAVAAGAETIEAPLDTPYGDRRAMVRDPYGNVFQIAHPLARRRLSAARSELDAAGQGAVDQEVGAGDEAGRRAGQEHRGAGDLVRPRHPAGRVERLGAGRTAPGRAARCPATRRRESRCCPATGCWPGCP